MAHYLQHIFAKQFAIFPELYYCCYVNTNRFEDLCKCYISTRQRFGHFETLFDSFQPQCIMHRVNRLHTHIDELPQAHSPVRAHRMCTRSHKTKRIRLWRYCLARCSKNAFFFIPESTGSCSLKGRVKSLFSLYNSGFAQSICQFLSEKHCLSSVFDASR